MALKFKGSIAILIILFNVNVSFAKKGGSKLEVVVIRDTSISRSEKKAILILPGLGDGKKQREAQIQAFSTPDYDLFIPDYIDKESFDATYSKFCDFHKDQQLGEYKELHVFAYILGTWTINTFIASNGTANIKSIVYDRSPMQERAPIIIVENIPRIAKMMFGQLPKDLSEMPYPTIDAQNVNIGIMVESKATMIIRHFKEETLAKGSLDWGAIDYQQDHDDLIYLHLDHDEMYLELGCFKSDLLTFFEKGHFTAKAQRNWYNWDAFEKLPKIKKRLVKYNEDFIGEWESEKFYSENKGDSVFNSISFQKEASHIHYHKTKATSENETSSTEKGNAKVDKKGTVIQFSATGNVIPLNQAPTKEADGRISIRLNAIKYYKK